MKFEEWVAFNKPFYKSKKIIVSVFKNKSQKGDDRILKTLVDLDACDKMFGDFEVIRFNQGAICDPDTEYRTVGIEVVLCPME